jgi:hypothetical protein
MNKRTLIDLCKLFLLVEFSVVFLYSVLSYVIVPLWGVLLGSVPLEEVIQTMLSVSYFNYFWERLVFIVVLVPVLLVFLIILMWIIHKVGLLT